MTYALIWLSGGIIEQVTFFESKLQAINALSEFVNGMDLHDDDAAIFGPKGLVAEAKNFLDENNEFIGSSQAVKELVSDEEEPDPIYVIGNPVHWLGYMVAPHDEPLGFKNPVEAVSELGQMRKEAENHLKLYRVVPVEKAIVSQAELEQYNADNEIEDFPFPLVEQYVTG